MNHDKSRDLAAWVESKLLPDLIIYSESPDDPVVVKHVPEPWILLGTGNYAAVFANSHDSEWVVKVYAEGRPGLTGEAEVYRMLGIHPAFSECLGVGHNYLILRRLRGITLYDCLLQGIPIPPSVISDVDEALIYARAKGLNPRDIHGKNILNDNGRGSVVDVSDFLLEGPDRLWRDMKRVYQWVYRPLLLRWTFRLPAFVLEGLRKGYQRIRKQRKNKSIDL
ncbi:serine/threonine-protein kinase [Paenibacillus taiwanensis]|uniref:serine/threonine-protein kinase n=1 Tax=Paenibacillus taiwanensis TaxID=401638 RepID=UPI0004087F53|nr:serine/threonine-protein kinase [Paenibacillus taiwanensis]